MRPSDLEAKPSDPPLRLWGRKELGTDRAEKRQARPLPESHQLLAVRSSGRGASYGLDIGTLLLVIAAVVVLGILMFCMAR